VFGLTTGKIKTKWVAATEGEKSSWLQDISSTISTFHNLATPERESFQRAHSTMNFRAIQPVGSEGSLESATRKKK
jgi:hypothetical protein